MTLSSSSAPIPTTHAPAFLPFLQSFLSLFFASTAVYSLGIYAASLQTPLFFQEVFWLAALAGLLAGLPLKRRFFSPSPASLLLRRLLAALWTAAAPPLLLLLLFVGWLHASWLIFHALLLGLLLAGELPTLRALWRQHQKSQEEFLFQQQGASPKTLALALTSSLLPFFLFPYWGRLWTGLLLGGIWALWLWPRSEKLPPPKEEDPTEEKTLAEEKEPTEEKTQQDENSPQDESSHPGEENPPEEKPPSEEKTLAEEKEPVAEKLPPDESSPQEKPPSEEGAPQSVPGWRHSLAGGVGLSLLLLSLGGVGWTFPDRTPDAEILYTSFAGTEKITLHASKEGTLWTYFITAGKNVAYQTIDAYRYAEVMVHPALSLNRHPARQTLIIGSESGTITRELLKYPQVKRIDLLPVLRGWFHFYHNDPLFRRQLGDLLGQHRLRVVPATSLHGAQAVHRSLIELAKKGRRYDLIIADLPRPRQGNTLLFHPTMFEKLLRLLHPQGVMSIHLGSPYMQGPLYWCLIGRLSRRGYFVTPYQLAPAYYFDYGFALVSRINLRPLKQRLRLPVSTRYLRQGQPFDLLASFSREGAPNGADLVPHCLLTHRQFLEP